MKSKYQKPALTFSEQAELIISRGLEVNNKDLLIRRLSEVNYYRLSAYWYPFRQNGGQDDCLEPGTQFEAVWQRYVFDRQLRLLVMDLIERIEVSLKTKMVNTFSLDYGGFGHLNKSSFREKADIKEYNRFISCLRTEAERSREQFIIHSKDKYLEFPDLPLWKACEIMSFGNMLTMYNLLNRDMQIEIAKKYFISGKVLISWLIVMNYIRNICAHHGRLWNRELAIKPEIPKKRNNQIFHIPSSLGNNRIYAVLTIQKYLLNIIAPQSRWKNRLIQLLAEYDEVPKKDMGFPEDWLDSPIWQQ